MMNVYTTMNGQMIKDYAYPAIKAEKCLKDLHNAVLDKRWDKAIEFVNHLEYWTGEVREAVAYMKVQNED